MKTSTTDYHAYGLRLRSEIALPLTAAKGQAEPDVTIRYGAVPEGLPEPVEKWGIWESGPGEFLLNLDGAARFRVSEGREIVVESAGGDDGLVTALLLSSVLAACLQQRGILTLQASAVATDAGAVLFAGSTRTGKSTLLAALVERGYPMLADDISGIVLDSGGRPTALPAFPCIRLWANAVDALGWGERTSERVRDGVGKFLAPVERFRAAPVAVRGIFALGVHGRDTIEIEGASSATAVRLLLRHTYRRKFLRGFGQGPQHFRAVTAVARRVPVACAIRPMYPFRPRRLADGIERRLHAEAAGTTEKEIRCNER